MWKPRSEAMERASDMQPTRLNGFFPTHEDELSLPVDIFSVLLPLLNPVADPEY